MIDVKLTVTEGLPPLARRSLTREVEAIRCREGITVRWVSPEQGEEGRTTGVQVVVVSWPVGAIAGDEHDWPVGLLITTESGSSVALVSVAAARRVIAAVGSPENPEALAAHRLGVILGRAVSHELGHYWLGRTHTAHGLMRAHISATDFADLRAGGFELDRSSSTRIRATLRAVTSAQTLSESHG